MKCAKCATKVLVEVDGELEEKKKLLCDADVAGLCMGQGCGAAAAVE